MPPHPAAARSPLHVALASAPRGYLAGVRCRLAREGIAAAVARRDTAALFDWIVPQLALQGISDAAAFAYARRHRAITWEAVSAALRDRPNCPLLRSWWSFAGCGFRKAAWTCSEPIHLTGCPLPRFDLRKGTLGQAAVGLALFVRDVANGDFVSWIDDRLAGADPGHDASGRGKLMREALLVPLVNIPGTGPKLWSMILAELLLGADSDRERWVATGAGFIAIDTLVHAFLHRTGLARRYGTPHAYGPACWLPGGCAVVINRLTEQIDATQHDPSYPRVFPRWVQHAIWFFCAESGWGLCNGRRIDDSERCQQWTCPASGSCERVALYPVR